MIGEMPIRSPLADACHRGANRDVDIMADPPLVGLMQLRDNGEWRMSAVGGIRNSICRRAEFRRERIGDGVYHLRAQDSPFYVVMRWSLPQQLPTKRLVRNGKDSLSIDDDSHSPSPR